MNRLKKFFAGMLVFALACGMYPAGNASMQEVLAAQGNPPQLKVGVSKGKLSILSGKKNLAGKTYAVKLNEKSVQLAVGNKNLSKVTYASSDKKILTVSRKGKVILKKPEKRLLQFVQNIKRKY